MTTNAADLYRLIVEIRRAFHALATTGDNLHSDLGVTSAMRALMEHLDAHGQTTVPDIARAKSVSRQHIQQVANALEAAGLLTFVANPRHKRSPFALLTPKGAETFAEIRNREAGVLADLAARLEDGDPASAADTIARLRAALAG